MTTKRGTTLLWLATLAFWAAGALPQTAAMLERTMASHLLLQLPLLGICGAYWLHRCQPLQSQLQRIDASGAVALVIGSGWLIFWMLPLNLDLAVFDPSTRLLKLLTVPLLIGMPIYWAWSRFGPVGRGVLLLEAWAMLARLAWLYLISPQALCSNYLISEQKQLGYWLLIGVIGSALVALGTGLFGPFRKPRLIDRYYRYNRPPCMSLNLPTTRSEP